jgi:thiamine-phosphate pyrophosphorylase
MKLDLYVVTDEGLAGGLPHSEIARRAVLGGADVIQLRDKTIPAPEMVRVGREIRKITRKARTLFIVNDRLDIALACEADGVHLGLDDMACGTARQLSPTDFIIGVSVGSVDEALAAERQGADYVAVSPVFSTGSKPDAGPGFGLSTLKDIRAAVHIPVIAIGGIGPANTAEVIRAGADGIAVISAVVSRADITAAARGLVAIIAAAKRARGGAP